MDRVPSLADVDLPAVLGIGLTAETRQRLDGIGHRLDLLRLPADELGWVIGNGPQDVAGSQPPPLALVGFQNSATGFDLGFYAARSYSLISPPRTGRRAIRCWLRSATGWSGLGGRSWRLRWGRRPL